MINDLKTAKLACWACAQLTVCLRLHKSRPANVLLYKSQWPDFFPEAAGLSPHVFNAITQAALQQQDRLYKVGDTIVANAPFSVKEYWDYRPLRVVDRATARSEYTKMLRAWRYGQNDFCFGRK